MKHVNLFLDLGQTKCSISETPVPLILCRWVKTAQIANLNFPFNSVFYYTAWQAIITCINVRSDVYAFLTTDIQPVLVISKVWTDKTHTRTAV